MFSSIIADEKEWVVLEKDLPTISKSKNRDYVRLNSIYISKIIDNVDEYNAEVFLTTGSSDNAYLNSSDSWDWEGNNTLRRKYDSMRNSSEKLDEMRTLMIAGLVINRIVSTFDVLFIARKHRGLLSFDTYDKSEEVGFKINYNF